MRGNNQGNEKKNEVTNPLLLDKTINDKLPDAEMKVFPTHRNSGIKIYFKNKNDKFSKLFKNKKILLSATITELEQ